jgi:hypothetical protein
MKKDIKADCKGASIKCGGQKLVKLYIHSRFFCEWCFIKLRVNVAITSIA